MTLTFILGKRTIIIIIIITTIINFLQRKVDKCIQTFLSEKIKINSNTY